MSQEVGDFRRTYSREYIVARVAEGRAWYAHDAQPGDVVEIIVGDRVRQVDGSCAYVEGDASGPKLHRDDGPMAFAAMLHAPRLDLARRALRAALARAGTPAAPSAT